MLVEVAGVVVAFGKRRILDGVSLEVASGSSVAVVGPSGSGKTTLAYCVSGALKPTEGQVRIDGRDPAKGANVALVQQTTNAVGRRNCRENIAMGGLARSMTRRAALAEADDAIAQVGLAAVSSLRAHLLSGGELQRLAIARAMVMRARVVVADEPTGQLDESTSEPIIDTLLQTATMNGVLILVTHDLVAARKCDRVVTLSDGRLLNDKG
ncbi:MAG: ATP-binding cassette domain-containing protein [Acidimicrobiia bacterium]|nr:ATP-binding cassette domain-containing protein [Acidimicrobiia bacterium]